MQSLPFELAHEARNWAAFIDARKSKGKLALGPRAIAEIKPHTQTGIRSGLEQLYKYRFGSKGSKPQYPTNPQWLVTYVAVNAVGQPIRTGRASAVKVFAQSVDWPSRNPAAPARGRPYDLGIKSLPAQIPYPRVDEPGFFGSAVEKDVRAHFFRKKEGKAHRGTGGSSPGPDAGTHELAALYAELSRLTRDPLLAEIAAELQSRTA